MTEERDSDAPWWEKAGIDPPPDEPDEPLEIDWKPPEQESAEQQGEGHDWDAESYHRVADPQEEWGREVLERLELRGDETVLDAGCGTGRVTKLLAERLPNGRLIGVDSSPAMIERARETLGSSAELIQSDLLELELDEPVDLVFSNATFHWILDHTKLFRNVYNWLKPQGRLISQAGGAGNVATVRAAISQVTREEPFAQFFVGAPKPWNFPTPFDETQILERLGFVKIDCWTERKVVTPPKPREYLSTVCLGAQLERLPANEHQAFIGRIGSHMPDHDAWMEWETPAGGKKSKARLEYVRLNVSAVRP